MKYKLRGNFSNNPNNALIEILKNRGVIDIDNFIKPSFKCELNPYNLDNIEKAADVLLKHLRNNSHICFLVDCD